MTLTHASWLIVVFASATLHSVCAEPAPRAAPPTWSDDDVEPFFADARDQLVGSRPETPNDAMQNATPGAAEEGDKFAWSRLIDADALATEVKRLSARLATPLASPAEFKSGGNEACRTDFAALAVIFAVVDDFDGDVRWKSDAAALSDALSRASANCKSASDQSYAEATQRRRELDDLIRGARLGGTPQPHVKRWSELADRKLLMQRMERGLKDAINPNVADERTFSRTAADVGHEAQVLALLAELIHRNNFEFWDDDTFGDYARDLREAAGELSRASAKQDYEAARSAAGRTGQSCVTCHEGYRG